MKSVSIGDLRAGSFDRGGVLRKILVLAGADDQSRRERLARNGPVILVVTAADEMHDLQVIAILDHYLA
jgi:hypothetical protein